MSGIRIILYLLICWVIMSCNGPDPQDPLNEFHIQNMTEDSVVCEYHCVSFRNAEANKISLASGEKKILYKANESDTLSASGLPHYNFKDMLFTNIKGDTLLYINPIVDSIWVIYDTTFYNNVYGGRKWIYKFYKQ